ncbi:TerB family tellurite resistance protein [Anderseniella sp. Alg231-50]|uniref:TerB family tellurite resistance protein n=1 Tax=Anderseniella sp. Alg231-50 TaxID=1922226 RepID=UPI000D54B874
MNKPVTKTINHHQALIYVMMTMIAVDAKIGNAELARIGRLVQTLPAFSGFDPERLTHVAQECGEILQEETGLQTALALIKAGLPAVLRETAYALAVEVAIADRNIAREEIRFLAMLRDALDLTKLQTAALEHAAIARYQSA